eukprot:2063103-Rhodomonas_salina.1
MQEQRAESKQAAAAAAKHRLKAKRTADAMGIPEGYIHLPSPRYRSTREIGGTIATRSPVLTCRMLLPGAARGSTSPGTATLVSRYALPGTETGH